MKYYALFVCDQWKSKSTMTLIGVFTKVKLIKILENSDFVIDKPINKTTDVNEIINALTYGHIEELSINEVL